MRTDNDQEPIDLSDDDDPPEDISAVERNNLTPRQVFVTEDTKETVTRTILSLLTSHWKDLQGEPITSFSIAIEQAGSSIRGRIVYQRRVNDSIEMTGDAEARLL